MNDDEIRRKHAELWTNDIMAQGETFFYKPKGRPDEMPQPDYELKKVLLDLYHYMVGVDTKKPTVTFPVALRNSTKKNKCRFDVNDKTSPLGSIIKNGENLFGDEYAYAKFDAYDLVRWASIKLGEMDNGTEEK